MKINIHCQVCTQKIAVADTDTLSEPMTGSMFVSHMERYGVEPPWHPDNTWEHMKCPYCRNAAFVYPDRVATTQKGDLYVFAEGYHKPDAEKSVYERNQEAINREFGADEGVLADIVAEADTEAAEPLMFKCPKCDYTNAKEVNVKRHRTMKGH